ncbi:MAG TPA: transketolase C-terminal domain-containing protein [Candidatus Dormibacteraeota bacterium]|nr:transketolase C-terminal domain-containing protein [Candidatus Dormibacteraeota bacterium]
MLFFEQKSLYGIKGEVPDDEHVDQLGTAEVRRSGKDRTVVDVRCLVPLDTRTILGEVRKTGHLFTVEENPRLCGWGAEIASIVAHECFDDLDGPIVRITTPHVPLPAAQSMEDAAMPSVERIVATVRGAMR